MKNEKLVGHVPEALAKKTFPINEIMLSLCDDSRNNRREKTGTWRDLGSWWGDWAPLCLFSAWTEASQATSS